MGVRNDEIRLGNLRLLVEERGSTDELERLTEASAVYLDQLLDGARLKSGKPRKMGDEIARKLESGLGKPDGWMDSPQWQREPSPPDQIVLSPEEQLHLVRIRRASAHARHIIKMVLDLDEDANRNGSSDKT